MDFCENGHDPPMIIESILIVGIKIESRDPCSPITIHLKTIFLNEIFCITLEL